MIEKLILIFALFGSAFLGVRAVMEALARIKGKPAHGQNADLQALAAELASVREEVSSLRAELAARSASPVTAVQPDGPEALRKENESWQSYDVPTFIRRGIPMPKLEPAAKPKARKRRKKSDVSATPATSAAFEIVA
ncbi:hypothetical protein [Thiobacter aerophilum]|uniref:DUF2339 domain-containing protein n=1 Tax=Thiobacter aerophilum TaxID=3121275 RepID=A0ABV0EH12_9BURK